MDSTEGRARRIVINGPRPSPLKIKKESHVIRKPSTSQFMKQQHGPVIIYTESPKIIHTKAQNFMALVQKLTGRHESTSSLKDMAEYSEETVCNDEHKNIEAQYSFSVETDNKRSSSSITSPAYKLCNHPYLADIPLFTPNTTNLFCSPQPTMGTSISPSFMDLLKGFSDQY